MPNTSCGGHSHYAPSMNMCERALTSTHKIAHHYYIPSHVSLVANAVTEDGTYQTMCQKYCNGLLA